jgi:putative flavoprotein involved in K+ transport
MARREEHFDTIVIGGGQAGLSTGYHLKRLGIPFVILDANERTGDAWRNRWDSLRLFSPAKFDALDGLPFPAPRHEFVTKDEMADYLEQYAQTFDLPIVHGANVDHLTRDGDRFVVTAGERRLTADQVVVAMGKQQSPVVPSFATQLSSEIVQLHSIEYRNPGQLRPGGILLVGAGNSGAEIAKEVAQTHPTWLSGRNVGQVPFRVSSMLGLNLLLPILFRVVFHRLLTVNTPIGRKIRPTVLSQGGPLIRVKRKELQGLGVRCVARTAGVQDGKPVLEDGQILDIANVIWCTGFHSGFSWIDLPVHGELEPLQDRGVARDVPGLYFVGQEFQYAMSSEMIHGVGRDAQYIAERVAESHASMARSAARAESQALAAGTAQGVSTRA